MLIQLVRAGYLVTGMDEAEATLPRPEAKTVATVAKETVTPRPSPGSPSGNAGSDRRRSMAGARLYLLGILEMQRHPLAAALLHDLQQARSDSTVIITMQAALQALPTLTSAGYTARVHQRLLEVLPLGHQAAMQGVASPQAESEAI